MTENVTGNYHSGTWKDPVKCTIIQNELVYGDLDRNLANARRLIDSVDQDDIDLMVLPELFATGFDYPNFPEYISRSDDVIGPMRDIAAERSTNVIFTQLVREGDDVLNRLFLIGRDGRIIGHYDKTHLFTRADEHLHFTAGNELKIFDVEGVKIGPLICYEARFPELSRKMVLAGAQVLVYPVQWPEFRVDQWTTLLRARAIENQCFVIGAGVYGDHGDSVMGGMSRGFSPFGNLLGGIEKGEGTVTFTMDPFEMYKFRERIPVLEEIRDDLEIH